MVKYSVLFEVRPAFLNNNYTSFCFKGLRRWPLIFQVNYLQSFSKLQTTWSHSLFRLGLSEWNLRTSNLFYFFYNRVDWCNWKLPTCFQNVSAHQITQRFFSLKYFWFYSVAVGESGVLLVNHIVTGDAAWMLTSLTMLTVLTRLKLKKNKNKMSSVLLSWFIGTSHAETEQIKCMFSQLQPSWHC
jgi:hypothetical protein